MVKKLGKKSTAKIGQKDLEVASKVVARAMPSKPSIPILSSIHLSFSKKKTVLSATDMQFGIRVEVDSESSSVGEIVVAGRQFVEMIPQLPSGEVILSSKDNDFFIKAPSVNTKLQSDSAKDFPSFPKKPKEQFVLKTSLLNQIEKRVVFAASNDPTRPVLTSILVKIDDRTMEVVGTDGFRLSRMGLKMKGVVKFLDDSLAQEFKKAPVEFLLPAKSLSEVVRIADHLDCSEVSFGVSDEMKQVFFSVGSASVYTRLIDGDFPPYEKIIPTNFSTEVDFDKEELLDQLKRALVFAKDSSYIIEFRVGKKRVEIASKTTSAGEFRGVCQDVRVVGDQSEVAFNIRYLIDYLSTMDSERVWFGMSEPLKPTMFKSQGESDNSYVVMPFRVTG